MDDETRAALDALTSGGKRKSTFARTKPEAAARERYKSSFTEPYIYKAPPTIPVPPVAPLVAEKYCYNPEERNLVSLKDQIATLSVDTASASIVFKGPVNTEFIQRIENSIPMTQREWLPSMKAWRFSPAALPMLKPILRDTYKDVQMLGVPKALPSTKFDQLMAKLSKDDKASIYKILASKYHPDKGGSHEVMTLINIVFRG